MALKFMAQESNFFLQFRTPWSAVFYTENAREDAL